MDPTFWVALFACVSTVVVGYLNYKTSQAAKAQVQEVHDFVNSKDQANTATIAELRGLVEELQAEIVRRADAAPAQGSLPAVPQPVTIESTKAPIPVVDVTSKK